MMNPAKADTYTASDSPFLGNRPFRKTTQLLMPATHIPTPQGAYDIYPGFDIGPGKIQLGFDALARAIARDSVVILEGFGGVFWEDFRARLDAALRQLGVTAAWTDVATAMRPEPEIERLVTPFLGGDDPLFGTRFTGTLADFFDRDRLAALQPDPRAPLNILYGPGAALAHWKGTLVYLDVPKIEIQFRSRAGVLCNLGMAKPIPPKPQYKRFYFVDWVALNAHKGEIADRIDWIVDAQRPDEPAITTGDTLRAALDRWSRGAWRVRPWFEPGPWGGEWILDHIPGLEKNVPNYAWSFELIVPENGLLLESDRRLLEVTFDFLMFRHYRAVLGRFADRFRYEFPIRFDFLDTFNGGNLSVQCHPRTEYIRKHFGETFTQDESYYILDAKPGATVYLGFQGDINPREFRAALERSFREGVEIPVEKFVNVEPAKKHDLFLIPGGTIHCSGRDNLVLEISSTPYIFTFKMYDWMRMDLDGKPRPLNIERAFQNLYFDRCGEAVKRDLVSHPRVLRDDAGGRLVHLPTHPKHFYDVHRFEFSKSMEAPTNGSPHVLSLVEGDSITVETSGGFRLPINYAETFSVCADAGSYRLISNNGKPVKVVTAFLKPEAAQE